ncbi:unnamed protein product [Eruca vesicaria subsp. sativa]|uniref:Secreted protein n=1 Tax=Eruca vesicaria subsp. sativa TaxID=29727 RepID=A0ABC8IWB4_ERUVS|nr:unnamed protein product [Eruca vesicaria subsp. sativa]
MVIGISILRRWSWAAARVAWSQKPLMYKLALVPLKQPPSSSVQLFPFCTNQLPESTLMPAMSMSIVSLFSVHC